MSNARQKVVTVLSDVTSRPATDFPDAAILNDMDIESLDQVELLCAIEAECNVTIPDSMVQKFATVGDIVRYVEENAKPIHTISKVEILRAK